MVTLAEEFWWRGLILPRQELAMGKVTWMVHGLLWTLFHLFWFWNTLLILPMCLAISLMVYQRKNTTPAIIAHFLINGVGVIPIVAGVLGK